jgi:hypothetical protein
VPRQQAARLQPQALPRHSQGQTLAGIAVGSGGVGTGFLGQARLQRIRSAGVSVREDLFQGVVAAQALEDQMPKGGQGSEEPVIKGPPFEGRQLPDLAAGQQAPESGGGLEAERLLGAGRFFVV